MRRWSIPNKLDVTVTSLNLSKGSPGIQPFWPWPWTFFFFFFFFFEGSKESICKRHNLSKLYKQFPKQTPYGTEGVEIKRLKKLISFYIGGKDDVFHLLFQGSLSPHTTIHQKPFFLLQSKRKKNKTKKFWL